MKPANQRTFLDNLPYRLFLTAAVVAPILTERKERDKGQGGALRTLDALTTGLLLTEGLKRAIPEKRPDSQERDSFPSGHSVATFAAATAVSRYDRRRAPLWYLGATLISLSRAARERHHLHDVLVGMGLGYAAGRLEVSRRTGLLTAPLLAAAERLDGAHD
jgi:membrane-associated phospholipid phosphatase